MPKLIGRIFGVVGFAIPAWYYSLHFAPLGDSAATHFLWSLCFLCQNYDGWNNWQSRVTRVLFFSTLNGALFAAIGWGLAKLWIIFRASDEHPLTNKR